MTQYDFVHLFIRNTSNRNPIAAEVLQQIEHDGVLWISYSNATTKMATDINWDKGWEMIMQMEYGRCCVSIYE